MIEGLLLTDDTMNSGLQCARKSIAVNFARAVLLFAWKEKAVAKMFEDYAFRCDLPDKRAFYQSCLFSVFAHVDEYEAFFGLLAVDMDVQMQIRQYDRPVRPKFIECGIGRPNFCRRCRH